MMVLKTTTMLETLQLKLLFNVGIAGIAVFLTYIGINEEAFWIFSGLLTIDYLTGILKAKTIGETITSNKMKYGAVSKMSLVIIPIVLGLGAKSLGVDDAKSVLFYGINVLILSEVYSVIANIHAIRTGQELPEIDVVAKIGKRIRKILGGE